jgi:hypothetical protein
VPCGSDPERAFGVIDDGIVAPVRWRRLQPVQIRYELSNYRCFPDDQSARLVIRPGFTSFIGINNAGKSTVLRSLFELREFFGQLTGNSAYYTADSPQGISVSRSLIHTSRHDRCGDIQPSGPWCGPSATHHRSRFQRDSQTGLDLD